MLEARGDQRLALEPRIDPARLADHHLDHDLAAQPAIAGCEDLAHPATRDLGADCVGRVVDAR